MDHTNSVFGLVIVQSSELSGCKCTCPANSSSIIVCNQSDDDEETVVSCATTETIQGFERRERGAGLRDDEKFPWLAVSLQDACCFVGGSGARSDDEARLIQSVGGGSSS